MGSIHLIRHGQASSGTDGFDRLSALGMRQSTALGTAWEASGWAPTVSVAGSMACHAQTAIAAIDACGQGDGYDIDAGWDQRDQGQTYAESVERVMTAFGEIVVAAGPGRQIAVFTSGDPIAIVVSHLLAGDASLFQRIDEVVINSSVTTIASGRRGPRLLSFNETGHLPRDMVTYG